MKPVITGISRLTSSNIDLSIKKHMNLAKDIRLVNDIERLAIASAGNVLEDAQIKFPIGSSDIAIYMGIDDAIEDIKDAYFNNIIKDGFFGVSPLLFPFTSPNALTAQVSIAFDIRGESITFSIRNSCMDVVKYAARCIVRDYTKKAIAGIIRLKNKKLRVNEGRYKAEFFFIETEASARKRSVKKYYHLRGISDVF